MKFRTLVLLVLLCVACCPAHQVQARVSRGSNEIQMQHALEAIFKAFGAYRVALGLNAEADQDLQSSRCIARLKCNLDAALERMQSSASAIREEVQGRKADDNRLGGTFGTSAAAGLAPAIPALANWVAVARSVQSGTHGLKQSSEKIQKSLDGTAASIKSAIDYLAFSGVPTTQLETDLDAALKGN